MRRCCVRGALPSTPYPAELFAAQERDAGAAQTVSVRASDALPSAVCLTGLFAALDGSAGDAAVCASGALPSAVCPQSCLPRRAGARGRRQSALLH